MSECANCRIYMALYAAERMKKPTNYGKITKTEYRRYKKMPRYKRPVFYVKRSYGEYVVDDNNRVHFYEVEDLTTGNPFIEPSKHTVSSIPKPPKAQLRLRTAPPKRLKSRDASQPLSQHLNPISPITPMTPDIEPLSVDLEHYHESKRAFLRGSGISDWSYEGSASDDIFL